LAGGWRFGWLVGTDPATGALRDAAATAAWVTGADSAELLRLIVAALDEPQPEEAA
jgi:aspartate/methionine/tyrosine aminotransferase